LCHQLLADSTAIATGRHPFPLPPLTSHSLRLRKATPFRASKPPNPSPQFPQVAGK
jgi:hypothetical protein